jgi:hypothetical protein
MVEAAILLSAFAFFLLGTMDLGIGVFYRHVLAQGARAGARAASVHGALAPSGWNGGSWGPSGYGPSPANGSDPKTQAVASSLGGIDSSQVNVSYTWVDGDNNPESRVRVNLTYTWTPMMGAIFGGTSVNLTATSTMPIAH